MVRNRLQPVRKPRSFHPKYDATATLGPVQIGPVFGLFVVAWAGTLNTTATVNSQVVDLLMASSDHQNSCLTHVVNLAEVDVMTHITKIAAVETSVATWEYDPSLPDNSVPESSLDVIMAVRTIVIKVCYVAIKYLVL